MNKRLAGILLTSAAVAGAVGLGVSPASADTIVSLTYPVSGSTYINAIHSSIPLGPGTLAASADLTTSAITGSISLPAATGSFSELGIVPVTATTEFVPSGPTTGTLESDGGIQATSKITRKFTHCLLATALINLTLPGPGNIITLTLGAPTGS